MRHRWLLFVPLLLVPILLVPACVVLFAGNPKAPDLPLIDQLHKLVQMRFDTPLPGALGMSRVLAPPSMGQHFQPVRTTGRDFIPENDGEREVIGKLETNGVQVGIYVFGSAVLKATPQALDYRALKGPGAVTRTTPRPAWYPYQAKLSSAPADSLPDWKAVYPVAQRAMRSFQDGGAGFETALESWDIAARTVATGKRCVMCHSDAQPIGGVLYAFRRTPR